MLNCAEQVQIQNNDKNKQTNKKTKNKKTQTNKNPNNNQKQNKTKQKQNNPPPKKNNNPKTTKLHIRHPQQHVFIQSCSNIQLNSKDGLKKTKKQTNKQTKKPNKLIVLIIIAFKGAIRLQHVRFSPGTIVCKSRATYRALITCDM